jgi:hypothetical protein
LTRHCGSLYLSLCGLAIPEFARSRAGCGRENMRQNSPHRMSASGENNFTNVLPVPHLR